MFFFSYLVNKMLNLFRGLFVCGGYVVVQCLCVFILMQLVVECLFVEFFCELVQQFQVFVGCFFGNDEGEYQIDWLIVDGIKFNVFFKGQQDIYYMIEFFQLVMGDGNVLVNFGIVQMFVFDQIVENLGFVEVVVILVNLIGNEFQYLFFVGCWYLVKGEFWGKNVIDGQGCVVYELIVFL